jgi:hypothetical protein
VGPFAGEGGREFIGTEEELNLRPTGQPVLKAGGEKKVFVRRKVITNEVKPFHEIAPPLRSSQGQLS